MRSSLRNYEASRIALIKPSALGDILNSLPILTALRQRYPAAHITWVVNSVYEPLLLGQPDLDETLGFNRSARGLNLLTSTASLLAELRRRRFDLVVDLQGLFRSGLMTLAAGAPRRVGLSSAREGSRWTYTDVLPVTNYESMHAIDRYWLVAEALGVGQEPKQFNLKIQETSRQQVRKLMAGCPRPWLGVAVGARWETKRWPPEHFAELLRQAQARFGGTAVFIGGRDDIPLAQQTAATLAGPFVDMTDKTSLPVLAALLDEMDVMISNDTGPLHLAVALGRPIVAPYTCTKVRLNGPYGSEHNAVETKVWCQGSYIKRCSRLECMSELTPDRLWPILERNLIEWERNCRSA